MSKSNKIKSIVTLSKNQIDSQIQKKISNLQTIITNIKTFCRGQIGKDYVNKKGI